MVPAVLAAFVALLVSDNTSTAAWCFMCTLGLFFGLFGSLVDVPCPPRCRFASTENERALRCILRDGRQFGILLRPFGENPDPETEHILRRSPIQFFTLDDFVAPWIDHIPRLWVPDCKWQETLLAIMQRAAVIVMTAPCDEPVLISNKERRFEGLAQELALILENGLSGRLLAIVDQSWIVARTQSNLNRKLEDAKLRVVRRWYERALTLRSRRRLRGELGRRWAGQLRTQRISVREIERMDNLLIAAPAYEARRRAGGRAISYVKFLTLVAQTERWLSRDNVKHNLRKAMDDVIRTTAAGAP